MSPAAKRPSQSSSGIRPALIIVGVLRKYKVLWYPAERAVPSVQVFSGAWQVEHEMELSPESRGSKKSSFPKSSTEAGLEAANAVLWSAVVEGPMRSTLADKMPAEAAKTTTMRRAAT